MNQQQSQSSAAAGSSAWQTPPLTSRGRTIVGDLAARHGFSEAAVAEMMAALQRGGGTQAQFDHPELGGMGQWSRGGMLMVGDMFNDALKAKVGALAAEAGGALAAGALFETPPAPTTLHRAAHGGSPTWPPDLGVPAATGSQNDLHYAFFPGRQRLAITRGGVTQVYDTQDHQIRGFGQQQGGSSSLTFTSQHGPVSLDRLRRVPMGETEGAETYAGNRDAASYEPEPVSAPASVGTHERPFSHAPGTTEAAQAGGGAAILGVIEGLAALHAKGVLNDEEFAAKKAELLARL